MGCQVGPAFLYIPAVLGEGRAVGGYPAQPATLGHVHGRIASSMAMISSRAASASSGQAILPISWQSWQRRDVRRS